MKGNVSRIVSMTSKIAGRVSPELVKGWSKADEALGVYFRSARDSGASEKTLKQIQKAQTELAKSFGMIKKEDLGSKKAKVAGHDYYEFHKKGDLHRNVLLQDLEVEYGVSFRDYDLSTTGIKAKNQKTEKILKKLFGGSKKASITAGRKVRLRSTVEDNVGSKYIATLEDKGDGIVLVLESRAQSGRWSWFLGSLLGFGKWGKNSRPAGDKLYLDHGQDWYVTGMKNVLREAFDRVDFGDGEGDGVIASSKHASDEMNEKQRIKQTKEMIPEIKKALDSKGIEYKSIKSTSIRGYDTSIDIILSDPKGAREHRDVIKGIFAKAFKKWNPNNKRGLKTPMGKPYGSTLIPKLGKIGILIEWY